LSNYPKEKSEVVGLPLREALFDDKYQKKFDPPLIYITCGKQGSHIINQALFPLIPELVKKYTVVHQTGASTLNKDVERARRLKDRLSDLKSRYIHSPYFFSEDVATYLRSASIVISRAGAHASYELMALHKKAVLIPIPWVSHNEQTLNAKLVAKTTGSVVLSEDELISETLLEAIIKLKQSSKLKKISKIELPVNATSKIIQIIHQYTQDS